MEVTFEYRARAADDAVESGTPQTPTERPLPTKRRKQSAKELAENNPYVLQAFQRQLQQREQEKEQLEEQHARLRSAKQEQLQEQQQRAEAAALSIATDVQALSAARAEIRQQSTRGDVSSKGSGHCGVHETTSRMVRSDDQTSSSKGAAGDGTRTTPHRRGGPAVVLHRHPRPAMPVGTLLSNKMR